MGLAIVIAIYRNRRTPLVDEYASMREGATTGGAARRRPSCRALPSRGPRRARRGPAAHARRRGRRGPRRERHRPSRLLVRPAARLPIAGFLLTALVGRRMGARLDHRGRRSSSSRLPSPCTRLPGRSSGAYGESASTSRSTVDPGRRPSRSRLGFLVDNLTAVMLIVVTTDRALVHVYSIGYMAHDPGVALLRLPQPLHVQHAAARPGGRLPAPLRGLGAGGPVELPAHRLLVPAAARRPWRQEGLPRQPRRRLRASSSASWASSCSRGTLERPRLVRAVRCEADPLDERHRALLLFIGAGGQERPVPVPRLAARRHGGPDPGQRPHPRRDDGQRRRLLRRAHHPALRQAPEALLIVASIGIFTAILAASIALTQTDIKRVLAYSTLSQLGYMFAALGVGAFVAAIFHLMAHGFFKGLLFLGSGSVIHAVHDEQDMDRMGALWRASPSPTGRSSSARSRSPASRRWPASSPRTRSWARSFKNGFQAVWVIGVIVAGHDRLLHVPAHGQDVLRREPRRSRGRAEHPRVAALDDGAAHPAGHPVDLPGPRHRPAPGRLDDDPSVARAGLPAAEETLGIHQPEYELFGHRRRADHHRRCRSPALGIGIGIWLFGFFRRATARSSGSSELDARRRSLYNASFAKWWFDDLNDLIFVRFGGVPSRRVMWFDVRVIDGIVNGIARSPRAPATASATSRPAASRTTPWASPLGLLVIAVTYIFVTR